MVDEGARFVAGEYLAVESLLLGDEAQEAVEGHLLHRLRGGSVELTGDVESLGVGVDPELDRGLEFSRIGLGGRLHRFSGWGFHLRLTTPCHLAIPIISSLVDSGYVRRILINEEDIIIQTFTEEENEITPAYMVDRIVKEIKK